MATKRKAAKPKTPSVTPTRLGKNGGSLRSGNPGNRGGAGRPPSLIREELRGSIAERASLLTDIMDGAPMQRAEFPLLTVLQHAHCPKCGDALTSDKPLADQLLVVVEGRVSASPKDRLAAYDTAAKYGLGALKEVSVENVRERVGATLEVIREHCPAKQAATIIAALRPVWAA